MTTDKEPTQKWRALDCLGSFWVDWGIIGGVSLAKLELFVSEEATRKWIKDYAEYLNKKSKVVFEIEIMNGLSEIITDLVDHGYKITFTRGKNKGCLKVELQRPELPDHLKLIVNQEVLVQVTEIVNLDFLKYVLEGMKKKIGEYEKENS